MRDYTPPNPYSFGDTARMERIIKAQKREFKIQELKKELQGEKENENR